MQDNPSFRSGSIFWDLAEQSLSSAARNLLEAKYPQAVRFSLATVEYGFKALSRFIGEPIGPTHDVAEEFERVCKKLPAPLRLPLLRFTEVGGSVNACCQLSEYGVPDAGLSPDDIFHEKQAAEKLEIARDAYAFCSRVIRGKLLSQLPDTQRVGILDGSVGGDAREVRDGAEKSPYTKWDANCWKAELEKLGCTCELISVSSLDQKYAAVFNPFGEEYPEIDLSRWEAFIKIRAYIGEGGILVCAGGTPMWYAWCTSPEFAGKDRRRTTVHEADAMLWPSRVEGDRLLMDRTYPIDGGFYGKRFFLSQVTPDNPQEATVREVPSLQGILDSGERKVMVFRATLGNLVRPITPLLEIEYKGGRAYPLCATSYKAGYLVSAGFDMSDDDGALIRLISRGALKFIEDRRKEVTQFRKMSKGKS